MPTITETYVEYAQRHGNNALEIGGRLLFADGAECSMEPEGWPRKEPPADEYELLVLKKRYVSEQLRRAEEEFNRTQSAFSESASLAYRYKNIPGPPENAPAILLELKARVFKHRQALRSINEQLAATPRGQLEAEEAEREMQRRTAMSSLSASINEITLS